MTSCLRLLAGLTPATGAIILSLVLTVAPALADGTGTGTGASGTVVISPNAAGGLFGHTDMNSDTRGVSASQAQASSDPAAPEPGGSALASGWSINGNN